MNADLVSIRIFQVKKLIGLTDKAKIRVEKLVRIPYAVLCWIW